MACNSQGSNSRRSRRKAQVDLSGGGGDCFRAWLTLFFGKYHAQTTCNPLGTLELEQHARRWEAANVYGNAARMLLCDAKVVPAHGQSECAERIVQRDGDFMRAALKAMGRRLIEALLRVEPATTHDWRRTATDGVVSSASKPASHARPGPVKLREKWECVAPERAARLAG